MTQAAEESQSQPQNNQTAVNAEGAWRNHHLRKP